MSSFLVHELTYTGGTVSADEINMVPFADEYYPQYERVYNECFCEMRKALGIRPYCFYSDPSQLEGRKEKIFLLADGGTIIGSVACCGTEIDDLFVNVKYRGRGYGRRLLAWAVNHMREYTDEPLTLRAAQWNEKALSLYAKAGFEITKTDRIIQADQYRLSEGSHRLSAGDYQ